MKSHLPHRHTDSQTAAAVSESMPSRDNFQIVADICKLLSDSNRLQVFWTLCHVEECVVNLAAILGISSPNLSHHLKLLKEANLIVSRREGKEVYYKAADTEQVQLLHQTVEQIMRVSCPKRQPCGCAEHTHEGMTQTEQIVEKVHAYLAAHLDERVTIEALSKKFLINSTTLKNSFKKMYGTSIAAHVKTHRLEKAAQLLLQTDQSVAQIAAEVGYANQSKFSAAFYEKYHALPLEYRKRNKNIAIPQGK